MVAAMHKITPAGALGMIVHHVGKDPDRGARGWSGIRAAVDAEIEASTVGAYRRLKVTKSKDGSSDARLDFQLSQVDLGDGYNSAIPVLVAGQAAAQAGASLGSFRKSGLPQGQNQRVTLQGLRDLYALTQGAIPIATLIDTCAPLIAYDPRRVDRRRESVLRAIDGLTSAGYARLVDGMLTPI
jgi:hypothetical protein